MDIGWMEEVPAHHREAVARLLAGPEEVRDLVLRAAEHRDEKDPPAWLAAAVRGLRPLSRKFIVMVLETAGLELVDSDWTRSLGFGDSCGWMPQ